MIKHNSLIDPSREGQALVSLFIRNKRPLLAASVFASNSTQWILLLAAEVLNMYYASYTCPLCGSQISASSFPNYARTNRGYICYACKFCDFCQGRATTALNGSNCCDKCLHKLCREYNGIVPPPKLLAPSPYEHADQGTTRILMNNKCYMLHNSVVLLSECNDTHHVDEASDCQMCRDISFKHCLRHNSICRAPGCAERVPNNISHGMFLLCARHFNEIGFLVLEVLGMCPTDNNAALKLLASSHILNNRALSDSSKTVWTNMMNKNLQ